MCNLVVVRSRPVHTVDLRRQLLNLAFEHLDPALVLLVRSLEPLGSPAAWSDASVDAGAKAAAVLGAPPGRSRCARSARLLLALHVLTVAHLHSLLSPKVETYLSATLAVRNHNSRSRRRFRSFSRRARQWLLE